MNWLVAFNFGVAALDFCAMACNILEGDWTVAVIDLVCGILCLYAGIIITKWEDKS